jgi:aminoglycoside phosphotransferase (APT) family kinase protein
VIRSLISDSSSVTGLNPGISRFSASALPRVTTGPGWLTRDEIVERYALRSGRAVDQIAWYHICNFRTGRRQVRQIFFRFYSGQDL